MPAVFDSADVVGCPHDTLGQQKPGGKGAIFAGGPHDHRERLPVQTDLERLLHRREDPASSHLPRATHGRRP